MGKLRQLRTEVLDALRADPWPRGLDTLAHYPPKSLIGPLFACLLEPDRLVTLRAATAFGVVTSRLYDWRPEEARRLLRDFMWRLNEESGNIGWGIPEAFGEILAIADKDLAEQFHLVLASYVHERDCDTGDNYLEHNPLRRGAYWALGRLAHARPEFALPAFPDLVSALDDGDPESRGFAAWALGPLLPLAKESVGAARVKLARLAPDDSAFELYENGALAPTTVAKQASRALEGENI